MFDPSLITYAVSLHFSPEITESITSTVEAIAEMTGNRFSVENKIPPHLTIEAFHAKKEDEPKLLKIIEGFVKNQESGSIRFLEADTFNGKVLFLKPEKIKYLTKINEELHKAVLPEFEKAENGYYLPGNWFPHTTLATRLNPSQIAKALEIAGRIKLPLDAAVREISVYQCGKRKCAKEPESKPSSIATKISEFML